MNLVNDPGLWQHFVKRADNIGKPIELVKQRYLTEMIQFEETLAEAINHQNQNLAQANTGAGGGTAMIPSVTPTVTPTISITPSITPTISITPSITPSLTPSISITPSITPSATPPPSPS